MHRITPRSDDFYRRAQQQQRQLCLSMTLFWTINSMHCTMHSTRESHWTWIFCIEQRTRQPCKRASNRMSHATTFICQVTSWRCCRRATFQNKSSGMSHVWTECSRRRQCFSINLALVGRNKILGRQTIFVPRQLLLMNCSELFWMDKQERPNTCSRRRTQQMNGTSLELLVQCRRLN